MKEMLFIGSDNELCVRTLYKDSDEFNLFPRGKYKDRKATDDDIKRFASELHEARENTKKEKGEPTK